MSSLKLATIHFQRRFNNSIDYHTINGVGFKILCRKYLLLEPVVISTLYGRKQVIFSITEAINIRTRTFDLFIVYIF